MIISDTMDLRLNMVLVSIFKQLVLERIKILPEIVYLVDDLVEWEEWHFSSWRRLLTLSVRVWASTSRLCLIITVWSGTVRVPFFGNGCQVFQILLNWSTSLMMTIKPQNNLLLLILLIRKLHLGFASYRRFPWRSSRFYVNRSLKWLNRWVHFKRTLWSRVLRLVLIFVPELLIQSLDLTHQILNLWFIYFFIGRLYGIFLLDLVGAICAFLTFEIWFLGIFRQWSWWKMVDLAAHRLDILMFVFGTHHFRWF